MTEQYPFFRDEDERTQAAIGEDAAISDLNGVYQKPYAILTQKRLYCKNEKGNFITNISAVHSTGAATISSEYNILSWVVILILVVMVGLMGMQSRGKSDLYGFILDHRESFEQFADIYRFTRAINLCGGVLLLVLILTLLLTITRKYKVATITACLPILIASLYDMMRRNYFSALNECYDISISIGFVGSREYGTIIDRFHIVILLSVFCALVACLSILTSKKKSIFQIVCSNGIFSFTPSLYSDKELKNFETQVKAIKAGVTNG